MLRQLPRDGRAALCAAVMIAGGMPRTVRSPAHRFPSAAACNNADTALCIVQAHFVLCKRLAAASMRPRRHSGTASGDQLLLSKMLVLRTHKASCGGWTRGRALRAGDGRCGNSGARDGTWAPRHGRKGSRGRMAMDRTGLLRV